MSKPSRAEANPRFPAVLVALPTNFNGRAQPSPFVHKFRMHLQSPELQMLGNADSASFSVVVSPGGGITKPCGGILHRMEAGAHVAFRLFGETDKGKRTQDALYLVMTAHNGQNGELL